MLDFIGLMSAIVGLAAQRSSELRLVFRYITIEILSIFFLGITHEVHLNFGYFFSTRWKFRYRRYFFEIHLDSSW